jgi:hypothetical protein
VGPLADARQESPPDRSEDRRQRDRPLAPGAGSATSATVNVETRLMPAMTK